jgi:hypothetical protein
VTLVMIFSLPARVWTELSIDFRLFDRPRAWFAEPGSLRAVCHRRMDASYVAGSSHRQGPRPHKNHRTTQTSLHQTLPLRGVPGPGTSRWWARICSTVCAGTLALHNSPGERAADPPCNLMGFEQEQTRIASELTDARRTLAAV